MGNLIFRVDGFTCVPPILAVTMQGAFVYKLDWDYDGIDYSITDPSTVIAVLVAKGSSGAYQVVEDNIPYTTRTYIIDDSVESNQTIYIKIELQNTSCKEFSNVHGFNHQ